MSLPYHLLPADVVWLQHNKTMRCVVKCGIHVVGEVPGHLSTMRCVLKCGIQVVGEALGDLSTSCPKP